MIRDVKDDPIFQVPSQEPSTSSKYELQGRGGSWHNSNHARELKFCTQVQIYISLWSMMSWMTPSSKSPVRNHQHHPNMTSRTGGSWLASNHARELKFGTQVENCITWWFMMSRMTPSSKSPVRNHQHPPSIISRTGDSWHTSNHARELKFGTQVKNHM